ncbi:platelet endothelial cell adhesion molecule isoform X4 [Antennarius striatus]|uniref:platelet endothelial cell adhesion molecule isoform X4 n=1 Tax=Antennarius striatus TaxID=241820 RepID=UPI0035B3E7FB
MAVFLLLFSVLLFSCFLPGTVVYAQRSFTIRDITLSIEPGPDVQRDINVTLRCRAIVSVSGQEALSREYTVYKDSRPIYTKASSTLEELLYPLPHARVSNSGRYKCAINIQGQQMISRVQKLTVTGLSKPLLHLNKSVVMKGEELTATCTAPNETGSILFYFYEGTKEIVEEQVNSNQVEVKFRLDSEGIHWIHCSYKVFVGGDSLKSNESNSIIVSVKELPFAVVLEIAPQSGIYEGDMVFISCTISNGSEDPHLSSEDPHLISEETHLYLSQGNKLLSSGHTKVNHSMMALTNSPEDFECKLEMGKIKKTTTKTVLVSELFSTPTLIMSPAEVFQKEYLTLTCKSKSYASERLRQEELSYTLDPLQSLLIPKEDGVFFGRVLQYDFNYTCVATARGIVKRSQTLTVRPKVSVSTPKISAVGLVVIGRPFQILCQSDTGSLPINYTLMEDYEPLRSVSVERSSDQAVFTVTISRSEQIKRYMCEAKNSRKEGELSKRLSVAVIEPLTEPTLIAGSAKFPNLPDVSEGDHLYLVCSVKGSPPVTFKWYRVGSELPLHITTSHDTNADYQIPALSKDHSGTYYCEAVNHANNVVRSDPVVIEVRLALWKKSVIGGVCLVALVVLVVLLVLRFRSKRARVDRGEVSVWTKRPPDADDEKSSSVASSEPDVEYTEVVHPPTADPARGAADSLDQGSVEYAELNSD